VAAEAARRDGRVIEIGGDPREGSVAILAAIRAGNVLTGYSGSRDAIVTSETALIDSRMLEPHHGPRRSDVAVAALVGAGNVIPVFRRRALRNNASVAGGAAGGSVLEDPTEVAGFTASAFVGSAERESGPEVIEIFLERSPGRSNRQQHQNCANDDRDRSRSHASHPPSRFQAHGIIST
jgi:hypothetical protein